MDDVTLATVTITKVLTEDDDILIRIDATCLDADDLPLVEALGMIELGKDTLIRQSTGEYLVDGDDD
jgi:hypothetical protein